MKAKKAKKRNPSDVTMRNIRALKKQAHHLKIRVKNLEELCHGIQLDMCFALNTFTDLAKKIEEEGERWKS